MKNYNNNEETIAVMTSCSEMFGFLARLYREEIDEVTIQQLSTLGPDHLADIDNDEIQEGSRLISKYCENPGSDILTDLAVEYTRIFLGWGPKQVNAAFPYESVYTSEQGLVMQAARDEVVALYQVEGLGKDHKYKEPEDHIAFELAYMQYLCQKTCHALENEDMKIADEYLKKQMIFLNKHLLRWVPDFCDDIQKAATVDFYKGAGKMTSGFVHLVWQLIEEIVPEPVSESVH